MSICSMTMVFFFFFSSRRRHTRCSRDWSSDVCSSDLNYSFLTEVEAILLDGHFVLEHSGRARSDVFFNFNGTAGIWRRRAIEEAGGWQHDTLTEDTDLSYRAQLKGWKFVYLQDVECPAELPIEMTAFKTQQARWAKGLIQTGRKILPRVLK